MRVNSRVLIGVLLSIQLLCVMGGRLPGWRYYAGEVPQSKWHGLEFVENDLEFECEEDIFATNTNGTCHNIRFPVYGLSDNLEIRYGDPNYPDGTGNEIDDSELPSARLVSNTVVDQPDGLDLNLKDATRLLIFLGQFIDHDFSLTLEQEEPNGEEMPIEVPEDDPVFDEEIEFFRSEFCRIDGVREFTSVNTPWLDLGTVYGDTEERTEILRAFVGGRLNVTIIDDREFPPLTPEGLFFCGDIRCEENTQLLAFHTLFLREHNRIADAYVEFVNLTLNATEQNATDFNATLDEEAFQHARLINIAQYQSIIWDFYMPYLLGRRTFFELTGDYAGLLEGSDPTLSVFFATAVYRYGHSGVSNDLQFRDIDGNQVRATLALAESFENPDPLLEDPENLAAIFVAQGTIAHDVLEQHCVSGIRNELFANLPRFEPGFDLIARNMQRGREHGLQSLNYYRDLFGLETFECPDDPQQCFRDLTQETEIADQLADLYGDIELCDVWVCGMAEANYEDSLLGETFTVVMADQFNRIRNGDRIWYENILEELEEDFGVLLSNLSIRFPARLADVIVNNLAVDLEGTDQLENVFVTSNTYVAFQGTERFQVEWALPAEIRDSEIEDFLVTVDGPDGDTTYEVEPSELWLYVTEDVTSGTTYTVTVEAELVDGSSVEIGEVEVNTAANVVVDGGDNTIAGLQPAAFYGIIGGVAGGIVILGAAFVVVKRKNTYSDDYNAAFF